MKDSIRVVLVYPAYPGETATPDRPPLGLLTVAAPLVEKGIEVVLLDERAEQGAFDGLLAEELEKKPVCVGISSMSGRHISGALRVSKFVKEQSTVPVVWGGVHPSLEPDATIRHELIDIIVRDDGEEIFPLLVERLAHDGDLSDIKGIGYKKDGEVIMNELADPATMENMPLYPFHLVDLAKYRSREMWTSERNVLPIETTRGCPFKCSFCTESVRKKKWRELSPERILNDIKEYIRLYHVRSFTFIDDNLFGNHNRGEKFVELLLQENIDIKWYTNVRSDYMARVSDEFIRKMEQSGCKMLTFGAESGSPRILEMIHKHATVEDVLTTNRKLAKTSIIPHFVSIRGFPTETREDAVKTMVLNLQLILENKKAVCSMPFLITTPGTVIARQCIEDDISAYTLEDWARIFDFEKGDRPPWVLDETFAFYHKYKFLQKLIQISHLSNKPRVYPRRSFDIVYYIYRIWSLLPYPVLRMGYHTVLRGMHLWFKLGLR